jgi:hypothetical protein
MEGLQRPLSSLLPWGSPEPNPLPRFPAYSILRHSLDDFSPLKNPKGSPNPSGVKSKCPTLASERSIQWFSPLPGANTPSF